MRYWDRPLLALLAAQPAQIRDVTLTRVAVAALARGPLPDAAMTRSYWWSRNPGTMGSRLQAIGWRMRTMGRGPDATLTFVRIETAPPLHACSFA